MIIEVNELLIITQNTIKLIQTLYIGLSLFG